MNYATTLVIMGYDPTHGGSKRTAEEFGRYGYFEQKEFSTRWRELTESSCFVNWKFFVKEV